MRVLALDTSTPITTCALVSEDGSVVWEKTLEGKAGDVLPAGLGPVKDFDAIAVGIGPGSFTGLRVGLSAAKALAYARKLPLAGASSLCAIALDRPGVVYAATEARKGELFVQRFTDGQPSGPMRVVMAADLAEQPVRTPPPARNIARLCLPRLRGASYDVQALFSLAPDYVQGFPR